MRRRRRRSPERGSATVSRAAPDPFGRIADRGDCDDARGYPDPGQELRGIERHVRIAGRDVLEVGCGNGRLTLEYAARARSVVALEPNPELVRIARANARSHALDNVWFSASTAQAGIRGGPFDVVLFSWSLC